MEDPPPFSNREEIAAEEKTTTETSELLEELVANLKKSLSVSVPFRSVSALASSITSDWEQIFSDVRQESARHAALKNHGARSKIAEKSSQFHTRIGCHARHPARLR
jgi:hypothetical protein